MVWLSSQILKRHLPLLLLSLYTLARADEITPLHDTGMVYNGKTSGVRYLSFLGDTRNKLISTSFASLGRCPSRYKLGTPCITFKLAKSGQLDDMDHHKGATPRQRNMVGSPDLDDGENTVTWNMMLTKAKAQNGFFHLGQIIGEDGPSWTMSVFQREVDDIVAIVDATTSGDQENMCDSMSLKSFMSAPMAISVSLDPSAQSMQWTVTNLKNRKVMMSCNKKGNAGLGKNNNVQGGAYRRIAEDGSSKPAVAMIGNFVVSKGHWGNLVNPK